MTDGQLAAIEVQLAGYRAKRSDGFFKHAIGATSQYDEVYRELALEKLWYREQIESLVKELRGARVDVKAAEAAFEAYDSELRGIDAVLARRDAIADKPTRIAKILHAIETAARAQRAEAGAERLLRQVDEITEARVLADKEAEQLRAENTRLDARQRDWESAHQAQRERADRLQEELNEIGVALDEQDIAGGDAPHRAIEPPQRIRIMTLFAEQQRLRAQRAEDALDRANAVIGPWFARGGKYDGALRGGDFIHAAAFRWFDGEVDRLRAKLAVADAEVLRLSSERDAEVSELREQLQFPGDAYEAMRALAAPNEPSSQQVGEESAISREWHITPRRPDAHTEGLVRFLETLKARGETPCVIWQIPKGTLTAEQIREAAPAEVRAQEVTREQVVQSIDEQLADQRAHMMTLVDAALPGRGDGAAVSTPVSKTDDAGSNPARPANINIAACRDAIATLRDAARIGGLGHFQRDDCVMLLHDALDRLEAS